tara:strand:- start:3072 stop:3296 length:225 start_codon:yes stop_codon:yes gene_type:complete
MTKSDILLSYLTEHDNFTELNFQKLILNIHQYILKSDYALKTGELDYPDFYSVINTFFDIADSETIDNFYEIIA